MKYNTWKECNKLKLERTWPNTNIKEIIDPGVNFFILMLEKLGCKTMYSCESHPEQNRSHFYIMFRSSIKIAKQIADLGWMEVRVTGGPHPIGTWTMETDFETLKYKNTNLDHLAKKWSRKFGKLNYVPKCK